MRSLLFSAVAVLVLAGALVDDPAHAQQRQTDSVERASFGAYLGGGLSNPSGPDDFKESWGVGTNLSGGVAFRINRRLMVRPAVSYHNFNLAGAAADTANGNYSIMTGMVDLLVELRYNPFQIWPYFIVGAGAFNGEKEVTNVGDADLGILSSGETRLGLNGGVGAKTHFNEYVGVFVEGKVVVGFTGEFGVMFGTGHGGLIVQF